MLHRLLLVLATLLGSIRRPLEYRNLGDLGFGAASLAFAPNFTKSSE